MRKLLTSDERGQVLMLFAGGLVVFLALVGLSVDVGKLVHTRTDLQKMSDAAALAAIQEIAGTTVDTTSATAVAEAYVTNNNGSGAVATTVGFSSSGGGGIDTVTVETSKTISYMFLRVLGLTGATPSATASAQVQIVTGYVFDDTTVFPYAIWGGNPATAGCTADYGLCDGEERIFRSAQHYEDQVAPDPATNANWNMGSLNFKGFFNGGDTAFDADEDTTLTYSYGGLADGQQPEEALERHYLQGTYIVLPVIETIDCQGGNNCSNPTSQIQFTIVAWTCVEIVQFNKNAANIDWIGEIVTDCTIAGGTTGGTPPQSGEPVIKTVGLVS